MTESSDSAEVLDLATMTARAARRWGERTALRFDPSGQTLTFNDVEARTNQVAHALIARGCQVGERIALMLRNTSAWPLAWLGIVKAGATMVPLNVFYRSTDAGYLLKHSGARLVICEADLVELVSASVDGDVAVVEVEQFFAQEVDRSAASPSPVAIGPESLANVQYTSGTTGKPKGCMLSNAWFLRFAQRMEFAQHQLGEQDVILTAQPFYYVDPQWNVALAMLVGAELVVLDRFHPRSFWQQVREHRVTWFYCLGVMPKLLLNQPPDRNDCEHDVRFVACSAIPRRDHAAIEARWGVPWYEHFGMTESGLDITVPVTEHDQLVGTGCIGRPMPTREARVVDDEDRPVARGETGHLVLRGTGLMDGYYRDPQATAAVFRNGWLHTGDLAYIDQGGLIYYVGRTKDMIRRSGENISAAEVEEVIMQHESVRLAACVAVPDDIRGEEVKAYVVRQAGHAGLTPQHLVTFCRERVAYFKVPRYWSWRDELPRTPSEKIIKSAITAQEADLRAGAYDAVDDCWR